MTAQEVINTIRAEIERRLKDYWKICFHDVKAYNEDSNVRELKELLSFLSTLESEKPMQEGLEEEIVRFFGANPIQYITDWPLLKNTALHFAQWGAEHLKR